jgi:hypothetical protein
MNRCSPSPASPDQTDTWQQHRIQEQQAFWERDHPK